MIDVRITLPIDDQLLALAKERAAIQGMTLSAFVEDALRAALARLDATSKLPPL